MNEEQFTVEELILRDHLALDRTKLANERTLLAYVRTSLMMVAAGATAVKLMDGGPSIVFTGWTFIVFGALVGVFGTWRFIAMKQKISIHRKPPKRR
jgi:putative membrane protein